MPDLGLGWFVFTPIGLLGFAIFFICVLSEGERTPFDIPEADSEIVAGYMTEYSGMKFAVFYMGQFLFNYALSVVAAIVFLGGWNFIGVGLLVRWGLPWLGNILSVVYLLIKAWFLFFVMIWLRGAFPRLRVDQLMAFAWKFLLPLALVNIFSAAIWVTIMLWGSDPKWTVNLSILGISLLGWLETLPIWGRQLVALAVTLLINLWRSASAAAQPPAARRDAGRAGAGSGVWRGAATINRERRRTRSEEAATNTQLCSLSHSLLVEVREAMNTLIMVIFVVLSAFTLAAGIMVVTVKNIIHSALWLIASFFTVAALYLLMEAEFIAIVQVLIYVGAISILILFAIMFTRHVTGEGVRQLYQRWWVALLVAAGLFGLLIAPTVANYSWDWGAGRGRSGRHDLIGGADRHGVYARILLPFEIASVLLLVALIGAIVIAYEERCARRRVLTLAEEFALRQPSRGEPLPSPPTAAIVGNSPEAPSQP